MPKWGGKMSFKKIVLFLFVFASTGVFAIQTSKKQSKNLDGSVTITEPRVIRGEYSLKILKTRGAGDHVCRLFNFDQSLWVKYSDSKGPVHSNAAILNEKGEYQGKSSGQVIERVTCYYTHELKQVISVKKIKENSDGSISFDSPRVRRGPYSMRISLTSQLGLCRLLGFDQLLFGLVNTENDGHTNMAFLSEEGVYQKKASGQALEKVTCALTEGLVSSKGTEVTLVYHSGQVSEQLRARLPVVIRRSNRSLRFLKWSL
jgi:hypothetical protein